MTKKECPVCVLLNLDSDFGNYIDSLLKQDVKISEVIVELTNRNYSVPSEHYLKKHKINCLKDFKVEFSQSNFSVIDNQSLKNKIKTDVDFLNMVEELEKYRNMSFNQKEKDYIVRLTEIKYMTSIKIHYQLLYGRSSHKAIVPKEDISALKQIEDILQLSKIEEKIGKQNEQLKNLTDEQVKTIAGWLAEDDELPNKNIA